MRSSGQPDRDVPNVPAAMSPYMKRALALLASAAIAVILVHGKPHRALHLMARKVNSACTDQRTTRSAHPADLHVLAFV